MAHQTIQELDRVHAGNHVFGRHSEESRKGGTTKNLIDEGFAEILRLVGGG